MAEKVEISNAEWEIMRLLWTLKHATSRQLIDLLSEKFDWKDATIKTLLRRLVDKNYVRIKEDGRSFIYYPNVSEQPTINHQIMNAFNKICQMHVGETLDFVLNQVPLSQKDIKQLEKTLAAKKKDAPDILKCNCLPNCRD